MRIHHFKLRIQIETYAFFERIFAYKNIYSKIKTSNMRVLFFAAHPVYRLDVLPEICVPFSTSVYMNTVFLNVLKSFLLKRSYILKKARPQQMKFTVSGGRSYAIFASVSHLKMYHASNFLTTDWRQNSIQLCAMFGLKSGFPPAQPSRQNQTLVRAEVYPSSKLRDHILVHTTSHL